MAEALDQAQGVYQGWQVRRSRTGVGAWQDRANGLNPRTVPIKKGDSPRSSAPSAPLAALLAVCGKPAYPYFGPEPMKPADWYSCVSIKEV